jgi:hypothetical protein
MKFNNLIVMNAEFKKNLNLNMPKPARYFASNIIETTNTLTAILSTGVGAPFKGCLEKKYITHIIPLDPAVEK